MRRISFSSAIWSLYVLPYSPLLFIVKSEVLQITPFSQIFFLPR